MLLSTCKTCGKQYWLDTEGPVSGDCPKCEGWKISEAIADLEGKAHDSMFYEPQTAKDAV